MCVSMFGKLTFETLLVSQLYAKICQNTLPSDGISSLTLETYLFCSYAILGKLAILTYTVRVFCVFFCVVSRMPRTDCTLNGGRPMNEPCGSYLTVELECLKAMPYSSVLSMSIEIIEHNLFLASGG